MKHLIKENIVALLAESRIKDKTEISANHNLPCLQAIMGLYIFAKTVWINYTIK